MLCDSPLLKLYSQLSLMKVRLLHVPHNPSYHQSTSRSSSRCWGSAKLIHITGAAHFRPSGSKVGVVVVVPSWSILEVKAHSRASGRLAKHTPYITTTGTPFAWENFKNQFHLKVCLRSVLQILSDNKNKLEHLYLDTQLIFRHFIWDLFLYQIFIKGKVGEKSSNRLLVRRYLSSPWFWYLSSKVPSFEISTNS